MVVVPVRSAVGSFEELFADGHGLAKLRDREVRRGAQEDVLEVEPGLSDAWPDLPELHDGVGLSGYFDAYAISAVLGCTKPDPRMYHHASDALGLAPNECVFVDDHVQHVEAALALGYQAHASCVTARRTSAVPYITNLRELLPLVS